MFEIAKPFFQLLTRKNFVISRWAIFKALVQLAILKRIYPSKSNIAIRLEKFKINAPSYHILSILIKEKFVDNEYYFSTPNSTPTIIDCGSNIGISVLYFKSLYPNSIIHCFEPYSKAYEFLEKNIKENHLDNIYLNKRALSDIESRMDLFIPQSGNIINASLNNSLNRETVEKVQSIKLSTYLSSLEFVDLIKLDVEGSELSIIKDLQSAGHLKKGTIGRFIIEFHAAIINEENAYEEFTELLTSHSYLVHSRILHPENIKSDLMLTVNRLDPQGTSSIGES